MAKVSGVPVENISSLNGVNASSTSKLMGVPTANIPGWPGGSGPSCTPDRYSYGRDTATACLGNFQFFDYDSSTGMLYVSGQCGTTLAPIGFYQWYVDNMLYYFDQVTPLRFYGACKGGK
jgi:hypothetical protein